MKKFKTFEQFVNESKATKDANFVSTLSQFNRMYQPVNKMMGSDMSQFVISSESRDWPDLHAKAEIGKVKTEPAKYKASFVMDNVKYDLTIDFEINYVGQENRDVPDPTVIDSETDGLAVKLENFEVKKVVLNSNSGNFDTMDLSPNAQKTVNDLLTTVSKQDFDVTDPSIYSSQS